MNKILFSNNSILRLFSSIVLITISLYCIVQGGLILKIALSILIFLISYEYISITEKINTLYLKITKSFLNIIIFLLSHLFHPDNALMYLFLPSFVWFFLGGTIADVIVEKDSKGIWKSIILLVIVSSIIPICKQLGYL